MRELLLLHTASTSLKLAGDLFAIAVLCLHIYGGITAWLFLMQQNSTVSGVQLCIVTRNWMQTMSVFQSPMQHESGFSFLFHFKYKYVFKPLERFVRGSE